MLVHRGCFVPYHIASGSASPLTIAISNIHTLCGLIDLDIILPLMQRATSTLMLFWPHASKCHFITNANCGFYTSRSRCQFTANAKCGFYSIPNNLFQYWPLIKRFFTLYYTPTFKFSFKYLQILLN